MRSQDRLHLAGEHTVDLVIKTVSCDHPTSYVYKRTDKPDSKFGEMINKLDALFCILCQLSLFLQSYDYVEFGLALLIGIIHTRLF